jgi:hypothetical protein
VVTSSVSAVVHAQNCGARWHIIVDAMTTPDRGDAQTAAQVAQIAARLSERADELADRMAAVIQDSVPLYEKGVVSHADLRSASLMNVHAALASLGRKPATSSPASRDHGRKRAAAASR